MYASVRDTELYFDIDGVSLAIDGNHMVERQVLFLLHGGPGGDHISFKTQVPELRNVAQLVYLDHRGSGRSKPADPGTYTLDENIDDLEALRSYLGLNRISILGSSYGGMVAQGYAIRYPDHVANLILVSTAPSFRFIEDAKQIVTERGTDEQKRVCQWLWDASFTNHNQLYEYYKVMGPMYATTFDPEEFDAGWERSKRNFEQLNHGFGGFLRTFDFTDALNRITCETLVIAGAHDWICPPHHSRLIADRIPRAHLKVFANSSHSVGQDEPEAFLNAVRGFLTYADS